MWSLKTGGLLTQVNYREEWAFGDLKGRFLNTGGLKDGFDYTCNDMALLWSMNDVLFKEYFVSSEAKGSIYIYLKQ